MRKFSPWNALGRLSIRNKILAGYMFLAVPLLALGAITWSINHGIQNEVNFMRNDAIPTLEADPKFASIQII